MGTFLNINHNVKKLFITLHNVFFIQYLASSDILKAFILPEMKK